MTSYSYGAASPARGGGGGSSSVSELLHSPPAPPVHHSHSHTTFAAPFAAPSAHMSHHAHSSSSPAGLVAAGLPSGHAALVHEKELLLGVTATNGRSSHFVARHMHHSGQRGSMAPNSGAKKMSLRKLRDSAAHNNAPPAALPADQGSLPTSPVKRARLNSSTTSARASMVRMSSLGSGGAGAAAAAAGGSDATSLAPPFSSSRVRRINFNVGLSPQRVSSRASVARHHLHSPSHATPTHHPAAGAITGEHSDAHTNFRPTLQRVRQELFVFLDACAAQDSTFHGRTAALQQETAALFHRLLHLETERTAAVARSDSTTTATSAAHALPAACPSTPAPLLIDVNAHAPLPAYSTPTQQKQHAATMPTPTLSSPTRIFAPLQHLTEEHEGVRIGVEQLERPAPKHMSLPPERGRARVAVEQELELSSMSVTELALPAPLKLDDDADADQVRWPPSQRASMTPAVRSARVVQVGEVEAGLVPDVEGLRYNPKTQRFENYADLRTELPFEQRADEHMILQLDGETDADALGDDVGDDENRPPHASRRRALAAKSGQLSQRTVEAREVSLNRPSFSVSSHSAMVTTSVYRVEDEDYSNRQPLSPRATLTNMPAAAADSRSRTPSKTIAAHLSPPLPPSHHASSPSKLMLNTLPMSPSLTARASPPRLSPSQRQLQASPQRSGHRHKRSASAFTMSTLPPLAEHGTASLTEVVGAALLRDAPNSTRSPFPATHAEGESAQLPPAAAKATPAAERGQANTERSVAAGVLDLFSSPLPLPSSARPSGGAFPFVNAFNHAQLAPNLFNSLANGAATASGSIAEPTAAASSASPRLSPSAAAVVSPLQLRRGSKRKSHCSPERTPLQHQSAATDSSAFASSPSMPPAYGFVDMCSLIQRLQRDKLSLLSVVQRRSAQRDELAVYVNNLRLRYMQRPFAVLKFHWRGSKHMPAVAVPPPSKWRALFSSTASSSSSSSSSSVPCARRWFALSLDGLSLCWSKQATLEHASSMPLAHLQDVAVGLVAVKHKDNEQEEPHAHETHVHNERTHKNGTTTPMFSLLHSSSLPVSSSVASSPRPPLSSAQLFDCRRALYAKVIQALHEQRKPESNNEQQEEQQMAVERHAANATAPSSSVRPSSPLSAAVVPSCPSFLPSSLLHSYHAVHWKVSFIGATRSLDLVMQTKSDLDVWIEFAQRVLGLKEQTNTAQ